MLKLSTMKTKNHYNDTSKLISTNSGSILEYGLDDRFGKQTLISSPTSN